MKTHGSRHSIPPIAILALTFVFGFIPSVGRCADLNSDIKQILAIYDEEFLTSMSLDLLVTYPTSLKKSQGRSTAHVAYGGVARGRYMTLGTISRDPLKFDPAAEGSRDSQGNYRLALDRQVAIGLEAGDWRVRNDREVLTIDPANNVLASNSQAPMVQVFPVGHHDAANLYYRYLLGLGRGYAQLLDEVTTVLVDEQGLLTVKANGKLFSPYCGEWTLEVDPKADYLVRKATFVRAGQSMPSFTSQSSGLHAGGTSLYEQGSVMIGKRYTITVELKSFTSVADTEMAEKVHARLTYDLQATDAATQAQIDELFPARTTIMDFRSEDSDGMPMVRKRLQ